MSDSLNAILVLIYIPYSDFPGPSCVTFTHLLLVPVQEIPLPTLTFWVETSPLAVFTTTFRWVEGPSASMKEERVTFRFSLSPASLFILDIDYSLCVTVTLLCLAIIYGFQVKMKLASHMKAQGLSWYSRCICLWCQSHEPTSFMSIWHKGSTFLDCVSLHGCASWTLEANHLVEPLLL